MYSKIVVPLDGSENSERSLSHVQELAKSLGSAIHLVQVISRSEDLPAYERGREQLGLICLLPEHGRPANQRSHNARGNLPGPVFRARLEDEGIAVSSAVMEGGPAEKIIEYAASEGADLIVIEHSGPGRNPAVPAGQHHRPGAAVGAPAGPGRSPED